MYPRPSEQELVRTLSFQNTTSFLIGRHLYERLVSGYRNIFQGANNYFASISKDILVKYRKLEPISYIHGKTIPTFTEFLRYIVDESRAQHHLNEHWAPVYSFCNPCQVNITHIIKFETFDRDTKMILDTVDLTQYLPASGKIKQNVSPGNTTYFLETYFNDLPLDLLQDLREVYQIDFDILGYPVR